MSGYIKLLFTIGDGKSEIKVLISFIVPEYGYASSTMWKIKQCASAIMDLTCDNDWLYIDCFLKAKVVSMKVLETCFLDDNEIDYQ